MLFLHPPARLMHRVQLFIKAVPPPAFFRMFLRQSRYGKSMEYPFLTGDLNGKGDITNGD